MLPNKLPKNFDHIFYADYYEDLGNFFGDYKEGLEEHYMHNGQFENRKYCNISDTFNWKKFLLFNKDKFDTIDKYTKENAIDYYLSNKTNDDIDYNDYINDINYKPIVLLYYIFLHPKKDWRIILKGQLYDINKTGILDKSTFHAVLTGSQSDIDEAKNIIKNILNVDFDTTETTKNQFEFPAIIKIRELALIHPDKIFIYMHSKGMVFNNRTSDRLLIEKVLTNNTLLNWETTLHIFDMYPNIKKASLFPSKQGFAWFNFWWARGSYLISCKPLEISSDLVYDDRFLCEEWLGSYGSNTWEDCYSIIHKKISCCDHPDIAVKEANELIAQYL